MANNMLSTENVLMPGVSSLQSADCALAEGPARELDAGTVESPWSNYTTLSVETMEPMTALESLDGDAADAKYEISQETPRASS